MAATFELRIISQHWLGEPHEQPRDGCSHGGLRAVIGGTVVTSADNEYGISQSALSLLRTLERDHSPADPVTGAYLLCHGCGYPTHFGCSNFGTDWVVRHEGETVSLSEPRHIDPVAGVTKFDVHARVSIEHYRSQLVAFADAVGDFFNAARPRQLEEWEQELHAQFWAEFGDRLKRAKMAPTGGIG